MVLQLHWNCHDCLRMRGRSEGRDTDNNRLRCIERKRDAKSYDRRTDNVRITRHAETKREHSFARVALAKEFDAQAAVIKLDGSIEGGRVDGHCGIMRFMSDPGAGSTFNVQVK